MAVTKAGIIKRIIVYGSLFAALNQFSPACAATLYYNTKRPAVVEANQKEDIPKDFGALEYLLLANSFAHRGAKSGYNCVEYAEATFHAYQKLARENNRGDISDKIRIVFGDLIDGKRVGRHAWLQYKDKNDDVIDFETTTFVPKLKIKEVKWLVQLNDVNQFYSRINQINMVSSRGSASMKPTKELIFYPGGGARIVYEEYIRK